MLLGYTRISTDPEDNANQPDALRQAECDKVLTETAGQMEVELVRARTVVGLHAAKLRGRLGGRPPVLNGAKIHTAKVLWAFGTPTAAEVARQVPCAPSTLYRHLPEGLAAVRSESAQTGR